MVFANENMLRKNIADLFDSHICHHGFIEPNMIFTRYFLALQI